ncbi:MAG TPA: TIR domain-containing protein [Candidatus Paceibacterota bacterium]|nr:TIR domain-containing protein [Candidatus Paceibacterota bacterium]
MARKIFISYKYGDPGVQHIQRPGEYDATTARHYVDVLQAHLDANDHINKGEDDGEDMSGFKDETIESNLRNKIFDSSITIVLISKNMKDPYLAEEDQWIPWEVAYSMKEITRDGRTSGTNGMLAVVLPDENGRYSYIVNHYPCVTSWNTASLFKILGNNMFNRNQKNLYQCTTCSGYHHTGQDHSYIHPVKWGDFIANINGYLDHVTNHQTNLDHFDIVKEV